MIIPSYFTFWPCTKTVFSRIINNFYLIATKFIISFWIQMCQFSFTSSRGPPGLSISALQPFPPLILVMVSYFFWCFALSIASPSLLTWAVRMGIAHAGWDLKGWVLKKKVSHFWTCTVLCECSSPAPRSCYCLGLQWTIRHRTFSIFLLVFFQNLSNN